ncbi:uncharacterized [Tachysurus ichikawai]
MVLVTLQKVGDVYHFPASQGFLQVNMSKDGPGFMLGGSNATFIESRGKLNMARDHFKGQIMRLRHIGQDQIKLAYRVSDLSRRSSVSSCWQRGGVTVLRTGILVKILSLELSDSRKWIATDAYDATPSA